MIWAVLTESLISDLCKLGPDFFKDGKSEGGSKAKGDRCSSSAPRRAVENPLRLLQYHFETILRPPFLDMKRHHLRSFLVRVRSGTEEVLVV